MTHTRYEDSERMIGALAYRVMARAHAAGAHSVDVEDVRSELTVAWCIARDKFDPSVPGTIWSAYLYQGMVNHINRWIAGQIQEGQARSLDIEVGDDTDLTLADTLASPDAGPHEIVERKAVRRHVLRTVTDDARAFIELLDEPTPEIVEALEAWQERSAFARSRGLTPSPAPKEVTANLVFDFLGYDRPKRREVYADLSSWAQR